MYVRVAQNVIKTVFLCLHVHDYLPTKLVLFLRNAGLLTYTYVCKVHISYLLLSDVYDIFNGEFHEENQLAHIYNLSLRLSQAWLMSKTSTHTCMGTCRGKPWS